MQKRYDVINLLSDESCFPEWDLGNITGSVLAWMAYRLNEAVQDINQYGSSWEAFYFFDEQQCYTVPISPEMSDENVGTILSGINTENPDWLAVIHKRQGSISAPNTKEGYDELVGEMDDLMTVYVSDDESEVWVDFVAINAFFGLNRRIRWLGRLKEMEDESFIIPQVLELSPEYDDDFDPNLMQMLYQRQSSTTITWLNE